MSGCHKAALCAIVMLTTNGVEAQQRSLTGSSSGNAYLQRQLRTLEQRSGASPESDALQLRKAQRGLITQSRGVAFTAEQARIRRGLDRVERELERDRRPAAAATVPSLPGSEGLPGSIGDDAALPSFNRTATLTRLVGRAEAAVADGRRDQARSDLAAARSLVPAGAGSPEDSSSIAALRARMSRLGASLGD